MLTTREPIRFEGSDPSLTVTLSKVVGTHHRR